MFRGLRVRLLFIGLGVALFAVVVSSLVVQRLTETDIRGSLSERMQRERDLQDELSLIAGLEGGWSDIADDVQRLSTAYDERIAVAAIDGTILADSEQLRFDRSAPLPRQAFALDPRSPLLTPNPSPAVLDRIGTAFPQFACITLDGGVFDLGIGHGPNSTAGGPSSDAPCFDPTFGPGGIVSGQMVEPPTAIAIDGFPVFPAAEPWVIEQAQLFVGYRDAPSSLFPSALSVRFWLAVGLLLAAAALAMVLTARRMLGPIDSLTAAAERMHHGDLGARAETRGRDELARLGTTFNEMAGALQASDQARRTLTSDVAHELRSPLSNLRGWIEGIQDGVVAPTPEVMASLHEEASALQGLVEDLQDLSLAESGHLPLHHESVELTDLLHRTVEAHQSAATTAGVRLTIEAPAAVTADGDPRRLRQVVTNLLTNAIRHTPPGGDVALVLTLNGSTAILTVADTGEGIAPEHLDRVFERFWRADASRTRATGGSGLGLAIVRQLVTAHRGTITVMSAPGHGTTFTISLPTIQ